MFQVTNIRYVGFRDEKSKVNAGAGGVAGRMANKYSTCKLHPSPCHCLFYSVILLYPWRDF
jgi:hypothetical protein